jgi:hypothetical protein
MFNAILLTHHFPSLWKHVFMTSVHKSGKDPALPHPIDPLVCWTRLVNYLKRSY